MPTHMYSWSERYNDAKVSSENIGLFWSRSQMMFRISINVRLDIFWTTELFVTKVGMVTGMVIIVKSQTVVPPAMGCCLPDHGHREGLCNQNMTVLYWRADAIKM